MDDGTPITHGKAPLHLLADRNLQPPSSDQPPPTNSAKFNTRPAESQAYGFEIDLEGLHSSDITDVFGGPGRGFPTGRGYDPATSVERYGSPTISEYTNGAVFGTKVTYSALHDGTSWDYGTPSGTFITPGDNCWSGGGLGYGPETPCDHFGVGTIGNPTKTTYSWLHESSPGVLTNANGIVHLPAPEWIVIPADPELPPAPPLVVARIEALNPAPGAEFGDCALGQSIHDRV